MENLVDVVDMHITAAIQASYQLSETAVACQAYCRRRQRMEYTSCALVCVGTCTEYMRTSIPSCSVFYTYGLEI
jgi:hypothetical protein